MRLFILNTGYLDSNFGGRAKLPVLAFLIETDDGYILYDTGSHPDAMKGYWPENMTSLFPLVQEKQERLEEQLALCGVDPKDIQTVVLSHMHMDHIGNIHQFAHADVYAPKEEFIFAQLKARLSADPITSGPYIKADLDRVVKQYHLIEEDFELAPGVEVINLPGHTPGLLGLVVHLDGGTFILPQDAINTTGNFGPPPRPTGLMYDENVYYESIEKVRELQEKYNAQIVFAHDWDNFMTFRTAPEYYS